MPIPRAPGSTSSRRSCGLILSILTRRPAAWYPVRHHQRRTAMLDLVIRGGDVVTPQGVGRWDVAIEGERIVALGLPEHGLQAGRVIDASGRIVVPGGIEPHTHLAHFISMQPEENLHTLGPEEDTRGMVFGGTTTHVDFCFVRPGTDVQQVIETRATRWKGNSYADYSFHVALQGALPIKLFDQLPEAVQAGFPSFKVFTVDVLPPHPRRHTYRLDYGRIQLAMEKIAPHDGIMVVHAEDHESPRGFCYHTYPSLKYPEDQAALWNGLVRDGVSTTATDEFPTSLELKLRGQDLENVTGGNLGAEARMGIVYSEGVVKRKMSLERFADVTATNAAKILGLYPKKGVIAPGSDADIAIIDPAIRKTLTREDFHVSDYSPWEGWAIQGWPVTTVLRGRVVVENRRLVSDSRDGKLVARKISPEVLRRPAC